MYKFINYLFLIFLFTISISFADIFEEYNYVRETTNIVMQDGIALATDIYRPEKAGEFPCVLARTPYNRKGHEKMIVPFIAQNLVVVIQDCRGTFESEGEFFPFINERKDGLETVKWVRNQNWANGKIAGFAGSYNGYTQLAVSDVIDFAVPDVTCADIREIVYPYGFFSPKTVYSWGFAMDGFGSPEKLKDSYQVLPLSAASFETYGRTNKFINEWLKHEFYDDFWKDQNHQGFAKCPMLSIAGWYDMFIGPQIEDFEALDENVRARSRMIVGPWCHGTQALKKEYGGEEKTGNRNEIIYKYIIANLKGENINKLFVAPYTNTKYNFFILERNEYIGSENWPPDNTKFMKFYFDANEYITFTNNAVSSPPLKGDLGGCKNELVDSREKAISLQHPPPCGHPLQRETLADGYISKRIPEKSGCLSYIYNPADPYPSLGGTVLGTEIGPADQSSNTSRTDQLVFELEIKDKPLTLLGPITVQLFVKTDTKSTDFFVCLLDVFPDGPIINIQTGGAKFLAQNKKAPQKLNFKIWPTGYQINPGHKLRVVITSSQFPAYNRNLNTGEPIYSAKKMKKTNQKIYFGKKYPSAIVLPIYEN